jgi:hypothetical protein
MSTQGYCEVAKNRSATPVRLYYEVHGHGIEHVIFIMGRLINALDNHSTHVYD